MTADDVRGELAAALDAHEPTWNEIYDEMRCICGADLYPDGIDAHRADALLPVVDRIAGKRAAEAATDALMWAAWTVEHSPGIKHQAKAVTAIRDRAAALDAES